MTDQHPITPPPELVQHWYNVARECKPDYEFDIAHQAARWGADQELEACCEWLLLNGWGQAINNLRAARRPKAPSLKEQALEAQQRMWNGGVTREDWELVRRALEQLDD